MQNKYTLEDINALHKNTLMEALGIEVISRTEDEIVGKMPVESRTHQPLGMLHGGASVALIESIGSVGSALLLNPEEAFPVGLEVNANHISTQRSGYVIARAKIVHKGKKTHVWTAEVRDENSNRLICVGRLTVMIVTKKN